MFGQSILSMKRILLVAIVASLIFLIPPVRVTHSSPQRAAQAAVYNIKTFGATGDGKTLDTAAINKAIDAAAAAGGGRVYFPAGSFLTYSIRLKSNVSLYLSDGATIVAGDSPMQPGTGYDLAEPMQLDKYQDYGHSHFHNSLIWGESL